MINLYQTPPNMSSIGAVCDSLGNTFLSFLVNNLGATGGLRLNSSQVKVKLIIFPLFLPKGNAILPITPKAVSDFHQLGPLGRVGLVVAKSVCLFVPFPCDFFAWLEWCGACLVRGLMRIVPRHRVEP